MEPVHTLYGLKVLVDQELWGVNYPANSLVRVSLNKEDLLALLPYRPFTEEIQKKLKVVKLEAKEVGL